LVGYAGGAVVGAAGALGLGELEAGGAVGAGVVGVEGPV